MLNRLLTAEIRQRLGFYPAVAILGPRQVGKTTLAAAVAAEHPGAVFLDLERESDRAVLSHQELFFAGQRDSLVVLDEVQFVPGLFAALRPEIDAHRQPGRFLLLGSAAGGLLRQSAESLAGRIGYLELTPLLVAELEPEALQLQSLWLRGGFPLSYLARNEAESFLWRQDFLSTFLQRDLPQMGVRVPAETLQRFWRMLAHLQGQFFNASQLGLSLGGVAHTTVARYLDLLVDTMMLRRLEPHLANVGKRIVKSPKVYLRDSGLLHALLGINTITALQGHPIAGASWEGFVVEQIAALAPPGSQIGFYRTAAGAEIDVVVTDGSRRIGFEVKLSAAPKPAKGFWQAKEDLALDRAFVVAPVQRRYPLAEDVEVLPVQLLAQAMRR
jgi:predicted AAA+ superfamily ATPase